MYEEVVWLSKQIISNSYSGKIINNQLLNKLDQILMDWVKLNKSKEIYSDKNLGNAIILKGFFLNMQSAQTYENKIKVLAKINNDEISKFLISEYYNFIVAFWTSSKRLHSNLYNILPTSVVQFVFDLYSFAIANDNLALFARIHEITTFDSKIRNKIFKQIVEVNSTKILNYLIDKLNFDQINHLLFADNSTIINYLKPDRIKIIIQKLIEKDSKAKSEAEYNRKGIIMLFHALQTLPFDATIAELIDMLMQAGVKVDDMDATGFSALQRSILSNSDDLMHFLIKKGANINCKENESNSTLLHLAVKYNQVSKIQLLIEAKLDLEAINNDGFTPLILGVIKNQLPAIEVLIKAGANIENPGGTIFTPLHLAAQLPNLDVVKYLVANKANLKAIDEKGNTILHQAAAVGKVQTIKYLLKNGADIEEKSTTKNTALYYAIRNNNIKAIYYLVKKKANMSLVNLDGLTAFHIAAASSNKQILTFLKKQKIDIHVKTSLGYNAIHLAIMNEQNDNIAVLQSFGIDINSMSNNGLTPIHLAVVYGHIDGLNALIKCNAKLDLPNELGYNLIHLAVSNNKIDFLEVLVKLKIDINALTNDGVFSPLGMAIRYKFFDIVETLINLGAKFDPKDKFMQLHISQTSSEIKSFLATIKNKSKTSTIVATNNIVKLERPVTYQSLVIETNTVNEERGPQTRRIKKSNNRQATISKNNARTSSTPIKPNKNNQSNKSSVNKEPRKENGKTQSQTKSNNAIQPNHEQIAKSLIEMERKKRSSDINQEKSRIKKEKKIELTLNLQKHDSNLLNYKLMNQNKLILGVDISISNSQANEIIDQTSNEIRAMKKNIYDNFHSIKVHVLYRSKELDHDAGRPVILINEANNEFTTIIGSSQAPRNSDTQQSLILKLSDNKQINTYFYRVVRGIKQEWIKKHLWNSSFILSEDDMRFIINLISLKDIKEICELIKLSTKDSSQSDHIKSKIPQLVEQAKNKSLLSICNVNLPHDKHFIEQSEIDTLTNHEKNKTEITSNCI